MTDYDYGYDVEEELTKHIIESIVSRKRSKALAPKYRDAAKVIIVAISQHPELCIPCIIKPNLTKIFSDIDLPEETLHALYDEITEDRLAYDFDPDVVLPAW